MIDHMDIESTCVHKDSEEAQLQLQMDSNATGKNPFIQGGTNTWKYFIISNIEKWKNTFQAIMSF